MVFELFDADMDLRITEGRLPHWFQPGVTYFITWRCDDSIPRDVLALGSPPRRLAPAARHRSGPDPLEGRTRPVAQPGSSMSSTPRFPASFSRISTGGMEHAC